MAVKYDQEIKKSQIGSSLYSKWLRIHNKENCCEEFRDFMKFYCWAIGAGFRLDMNLARYDADEGYDPENCFWEAQREKSKYGEASKSDIVRYNETVNRIRRACGMCPLEEMVKEDADG